MDHNPNKAKVFMEDEREKRGGSQQIYKNCIGLSESDAAT